MQSLSQYKQLSLALALPDDARFENFITPAEARVWLPLLSDSQQWQDPVFLVTPPGFGCSHLLQAACHTAQQQGLTVQYLALDDLLMIEGLQPEAVLDGLEQTNLLVLDDVHLLAGKLAWQEAVFHLYNRISQSGCRLLMGSHRLASQLDFELRDLISRFSWGLNISLPALGDEDLMALLRQRALARGMLLDERVALYILNRFERSPKSLMAVLQVLEKTSLEDSRCLTIPFVKNCLDSYRAEV